VQAALPAAGWDNPTGRLVYCDGPTVAAEADGAPIGPEAALRVRLPLPAGPHRVPVAPRDEPRGAGVGELYSGEVELGGAVSSLVIDGPYEPSGAGETPSRRAIFVCRPASAVEELPCARQIVTRLATRAYRRPVAADSDEA